MGKPAPKGNKYALGNKGGGRKGYEWESRQRTRMKEIVDEYLGLVQNILDDPKEEDVTKLKILEKSLLKVLDKMHASKSEEKREYELGDNIIALIQNANKETNNHLPGPSEE